MTLTDGQKIHARGCKHFTGIQNDACEAGVRYDSFKTGELPYQPLMDGQYHGHCQLLELRTIEEIDEQERAGIAAAQKFIKALADNLCPECGEKVTSKRQVGRCVYGDPCGHRQYQGKLNPSESNSEE